MGGRRMQVKKIDKVNKEKNKVKKKVGQKWFQKEIRRGKEK